MKTIYNFTAKNINGENTSLSKYKGKVVLIVNTASKCGLTPQYEGLENLYQQFRGSNFEILGFPCNQFGFQEPGTEKEIQQGCLLNYGVSFPMFSKVKVNGFNTHPLYKYLKDQQSGVLLKRIKWNFTKFLINKEGIPIKRFAPSTEPKELEQEITNLLTLQS